MWDQSLNQQVLLGDIMKQISDPKRHIESLYQRSDEMMNEENVVHLHTPDNLSASLLMDDISAILQHPENLPVAEPVLREALQLISNRLLFGRK